MARPIVLKGLSQQQMGADTETHTQTLGPERAQIEDLHGSLPLEIEEPQGRGTGRNVGARAVENIESMVHRFQLSRAHRGP